MSTSFCILIQAISPSNGVQSMRSCSQELKANHIIVIQIRLNLLSYYAYDSLRFIELSIRVPLADLGDDVANLLYSVCTS